MKSPARPGPRVRLRVTLRGAVQGVGFRPFVHRLATDLALSGWVNNSSQGVFLEAESPRPALEQFLHRLAAEKPPRSFIQSMETIWLDAVGFKRFEIRDSDTGGDRTALVLPDIATCPDCLRETFDPKNRRFRYPFTNCTNCGPRFSLVEAVPYDRANTSMKAFALCPACAAEYGNPDDRRFHAQPNACPVCGPRLEFWDADGAAIFGGDEALLAAARAIQRGKIVAAKGVGGFHLLADARSQKAIQLLRERKHRKEKPFALLFPSLESIRTVCEVSPLEERLLGSPEAPIVLLRRRAQAEKSDGKFSVAAEVAPRNPQLGVMLPANPLHHLLMAELGFPVVATSGNLSEEPVCIEEHETLVRLRGIADFFLVHDRPIVRQVDDSIVRVILDREMILRRARGYAPLPLPLPKPEAAARTQTVLAVGAQLKNAVALAVGETVFISQHIGDLETESADQAFRRVITDFQKLYGTEAEIVAGDLHPDYGSTRFARACGKPFVGVQHHVAHVLSCIAENEVILPALGVAWDGTGYGPDGTIWGGEFFVVSPGRVERRAWLRPFPLPGGEAAIKEPRRAALGLLYELFGEAVFERSGWAPVAAFSASELGLLRMMLQRGLNSPRTSSIGRLFDAVASVTGLRQRTQFEGQAAMDLEFAMDGIKTDEAYELRIADGGSRSGKPRECVTESAVMMDWFPLVEELISDVEHRVAVGEISAKFHNALAEAVVEIARRLGLARVALSGGCFQNRYLTERVVRRLREEQFLPYWHQRVPANDGGIAFGQIVAARNHLPLK